MRLQQTDNSILNRVGMIFIHVRLLIVEKLYSIKTLRPFDCKRFSLCHHLIDNTEIAPEVTQLFSYGLSDFF